MGLFPDCFFFSPSEDRPAVLLHERSTDFFDLQSFSFFVLLFRVWVISLARGFAPCTPTTFCKRLTKTLLAYGVPYGSLV